MDLSEQIVYSMLVEKSQEAFVMAIEIYNKPTIKYRVEGFSFFICNAWELMLKAKLIKDNGENSIYYNDNKERTISLENCIKKVFTNEKDPLRKNLEKIIELRNTSTHFITQEYELIYVPLFQSCVYNFVDKIYKFHNIDISNKIPMHFINLTLGDSFLQEKEIKTKYSQQIFNRFLKVQKQIQELLNQEKSDRFAILIQQDVKLVKDKNESIPSFRLIRVGEKSDGNVQLIKEIQDPNNTHPYSATKVVEHINKRLNVKNINISFTKSDFNNFNKYYGFKDNIAYCFVNKTYSTPTFQYSQKVIDLITSEIQLDRNICKTIREKLKENKTKPTPGAKDSK